MNRRLQFINLFGVLALVVLCVIQWNNNRHLNLEINRLEKNRLAQDEKLSEQEKTIHGLTDDLSRFKEQFTRAHEEAADARKKLHTAEQENEQLLGQCGQLRENLTNWMNAVTERDAQIKIANERITEFAERLNDSIQKFNQLATNHNEVVARYNELLQKTQAK